MKQLTLQLDLTVESGPYLGVCQALQTTPPLVNNCYEILASTNLQPLIAVEWYLFIYHSYPTPKIILCVLVCWYLTIFTPSNAHAHPSNIITFDFKWAARQKVIVCLIICYSFEVENWKSFFSALWRISSFSWIIQRKLSKKGKLSERQEKNLCSSWQIWLLQFKISHLFIPSRKADIEKTLEMQRMTEYWHWWLCLLVLCSFNLILKSWTN